MVYFLVESRPSVWYVVKGFELGIVRESSFGCAGVNDWKNHCQLATMRRGSNVPTRKLLH